MMHRVDPPGRQPTTPLLIYGAIDTSGPKPFFSEILVNYCQTQ